MEGAKALIACIRMYIRVHLGERNPVALIVAAQCIDEVVSDGIAALVSRVHNELLPTFHWLLGFVE